MRLRRIKTGNPYTGLVVCESVIDSTQFYHADHHEEDDMPYGLDGNDYKYSDVRAFLLNDFYNLSFTETEKDLIRPTFLVYDDYEAEDGGRRPYDCGRFEQRL